MKRTIILAHPEARRRALEAVRTAPDDYVVTVSGRTRTLEQNALLWPLLTAVSKQVVWHGHVLTQEEWKDMFTASLKKSRVMPNLDNTGFVILGQRTSKMGKREFSDLLELIYAFGAERDVDFGSGPHQLGHEPDDVIRNRVIEEQLMIGV